MTIRFRSNYLRVQSSFEPVFQDLSLENLWAHSRLKPFKAKRDREILTLELGGEVFFVKRYFGPGVGIVKYILRGFRDKYGPENEWQKAHLLKNEGIRAVEPVAFGVERRFGIISRALLVTLKMEGSRVEDVLREKGDLDRKVLVVKELAAFAGRFHTLGLSHQDFYLCHLFWSPDSKEISLVDLQRIRYYKGSKGQPRMRWVVKDLAQLDYSAQNTLGGEEYNHLKKTFLSIYKQYLPSVVEPGVIGKIRNKVARISRHDRKLKARAKAKVR